jgi:hypothetical protein
MARVGIPIFTAEPTTVTELGFLLPTKWEQTRPNIYTLDYWRPGMALCALGGVICDFIDIDPATTGTKESKTPTKPEDSEVVASGRLGGCRGRPYF